MSQQETVQRALATLMGQQLVPGSTIKAETLEEALGIKRTDPAFMFLVSRIRQSLYDFGIYFSGEGFKETGCFEIAPPTENRHILQRGLDRAERDIEGKIRLCVNTNTSGFNEYEKRKHENTLRQASLKLDAMRQAREFEAKLKRLPKKLVVDVETETTEETSS
jgi:hypothetical protein